MTLNFANDAFVVGAKDREDLIYLRDSKDCQVNVQDFTSDKTDSVNIYDTGAPNYKSAGNDVIQDRYNDKASIWNNRTHKYHDYKNSRYVNEDNAQKQF